MLKEKTATAQRTIILIRHGQYQMDTKDKFLTELGWFYILFHILRLKLV